MKIWKIKLTDTSDTTAFAAKEFERLIKKADCEARVSLADDGALEIGLRPDFTHPAVKDSTLDDAISIDVRNMSGHITGSNARSVLFATYRLFVECGAVYARPGRDGEVIPEIKSEELCVKLCEAAATRYRGVCLEGSAGYEHIVELIDYSAKLGMNIFFTQLWRPTFAFNRWYQNKKSPSYVPSDFSEDAQDVAVIEYEKEIFRRGLNHHKMGHGYMPSILGEKSGIWHGISRKGLLTEEKRKLVAEINGERVLFNGSAVDTSFCYGNPEARELIVKEVVKYAEEHSEVDTLHFWLADQPDNQCECELCRDTLPSDFYIDMCNELDAALTAKGIKTRIVFLVYLELFWAPKVARIKNPDRFMLIFAPIRRPYERPLSAQTEGTPFPFARNKWKNPCTNFSALHYLNEWKTQFPGECILFDYHLMWDMYNDVTGVETGKLFGTDMAELEKNGMCGAISCQGVRVGIFGALPMLLMSRALWYKNNDYEPTVKAYYNALFGAEADKCRAVLDEVRAALHPNILRGVVKVGEEHLAVLAKARAAIRELDGIRARYAYDTDFSRRVSYLYLGEQLRLSDLLIDFISAALKGEESEASRIWARVLVTVNEIEALYPRALDAFEFALVWHRHVLPLFFPNWKIDYDSGELTM